MRVGWLADKANYVGGAELTMGEFRAAAPEGVEIVDCPAGEVWDDEFDVAVIHNCVTYTAEGLASLVPSTRVFKYWHDVGPHIQPDVRKHLDKWTRAICCSPVQAGYMGIEGAEYIPPAIDLARFEQAQTGERKGAVCVGSWRNFGKAPHRAAEFAQGNGGIDFFGSGPFAPPGSVEVAYDAMPMLLGRYETFVYLPTVIEPFGRLVAEAYAAGCEIVTNDLVGAKWWIEHDPGALYTAAEDFWRTVLAE